MIWHRYCLSEEWRWMEEMNVTEVKIRVQYKKPTKWVQFTIPTTIHGLVADGIHAQCGYELQAHGKKGHASLLETHCKYLQGAKCDDLLTVRTWMSGLQVSD